MGGSGQVSFTSGAISRKMETRPAAGPMRRGRYHEKKHGKTAGHSVYLPRRLLVKRLKIPRSGPIIICKNKTDKRGGGRSPGIWKSEKSKRKL